MKKFLSLLMAGAMLLSLTPASGAQSSDAEEELVNAIASEAQTFLASEDGDVNMYANMDWTSVADTLPSKFDLRDRGIVPEVRNQGDWGSCWAFGTMAAVETSMLSTLGMTLEEFAGATGLEMDMSEKHLAWFGTSHLPLQEDYAEGEYPYDADQAGEGLWQSNQDTSPNEAHYDNGGYEGYSSTVFANGCGPELESNYPYEANDGSNSPMADWSLPEEARYGMAAEMKNSSILPSPAERDSEGNYVYNPAGTEAIKQELLAGRGVSLAYHADTSMSEGSLIALNVQALIRQGIPEDIATTYVRYYFGYLKSADMTQEEKRQVLAYFALDEGVATEDELTDEYLDQLVEANFEAIDEQMQASFEEEDSESAEAEPLTPEEEAERREAAALLGIDYDVYAERAAVIEAANSAVYINTETYAQYVDSADAQANHSVCIIGWDDDYAVSNFPADHQPPAPGAWIVRNSWGAAYGNDGYFYLSYYDESLTGPETFEFVFDYDAAEGVSIVAYDNMESISISSVQEEKPVFLANVFPVDADSVLSYISVLTSDLNAQVTANIYLLNDNYTSPTDGVLLDSVTEKFEFGGYHRIALNYSFELPEGAVISVVERQILQTTEGTRYAVPYTNALGLEASEAKLTLYPYQSMTGAVSWAEGCIGQGESFVCLDSSWYDWADLVGEVQSGNPYADLVAFDNLNIKIYLYTKDGVYEQHAFSEAQSFGSGEALICDDCGEMLVIVNV